jgi:hypothetical protein
LPSARRNSGSRASGATEIKLQQARSVSVQP